MRRGLYLAVFWLSAAAHGQERFFSHIRTVPSLCRAYQMDNMAQPIYLGKTDKPRLELYLQVRGPVRLGFEYDSPLPFRAALDSVFGPACPKVSFEPDSDSVRQGWTVKDDVNDEMGPYLLPLGRFDRAVEFVYAHPWLWLLLGGGALVARLRRRDRVQLVVISEPPGSEITSQDRAFSRSWNGTIWIDRGQLGDRLSFRMAQTGFEVRQESIPAEWFAPARRGTRLQWGPITLQSRSRGASSPWELKVGETVAGYRIQERLGEGVSAVVYRVVRMADESEEPLALKVLKPAELIGLMPRFRREMGALSRLQHPNIPYLVDFGEYRDMPYLAMELLHGRSLAEQSLPLPLSQGCAILRQLAQALQYAHQRGVLHRDIKPENVVLGKDGLAKLTDFGLSRTHDSSTLTVEGTLLGTPAYMAPEIASGSPASSRSDLYSLACLAVHVFSGSPPYSGESPLAVVVQHLQSPPPDLAALCPELPGPIRDCLQSMLAKAPEERPSNLQDLLCALEDSP